MFPDLRGIEDDPTDITRMKYVVILKNYEGELRRVRCCLWNDLGIQKRREALIDNPPDVDDKPWNEVIMWSVENMKPEDFRMHAG